MGHGLIAREVPAVSTRSPERCPTARWLDRWPSPGRRRAPRGSGGGSTSARSTSARSTSARWLCPVRSIPDVVPVGPPAWWRPGLLPNHDLAPEETNLFAPLVEALGLHRDHSPVVP